MIKALKDLVAMIACGKNLKEVVIQKPVYECLNLDEDDTYIEAIEIALRQIESSLDDKDEFEREVVDLKDKCEELEEELEEVYGKELEGTSFITPCGEITYKCTAMQDELIMEEFSRLMNNSPSDILKLLTKLNNI